MFGYLKDILFDKDAFATAMSGIRWRVVLKSALAAFGILGSKGLLPSWFGIDTAAWWAAVPALVAAIGLPTVSKAEQTAATTPATLADLIAAARPEDLVNAHVAIADAQAKAIASAP